MIILKSTTLKDRFFEYSQYVMEGGYTVSEKTKPQIDKFFNTLEEGKYGIVIYGKCGTGKTQLFDTVRKLLTTKDKIYFRKRSALDIVLDFNTHGHQIFRQDDNNNVFYDDLGSEEDGYRYGEKVNTFEKFIQLRYNIYRSHGKVTHFTTNLTEKEVQKKYGERCWSRLREMCKHVILNDEDKRPLRNFIGYPQLQEQVTRSKEEIEWEENYKKHKEKIKNTPKEPHKTLGEKAREMYGIKTHMVQKDLQNPNQESSANA